MHTINLVKSFFTHIMHHMICIMFIKEECISYLKIRDTNSEVTTMERTSINLSKKTKKELDNFLGFYIRNIAKFAKKPVSRITYDDVIRFLLEHVKIPETPLIRQ